MHRERRKAHWFIQPRWPQPQLSPAGEGVQPVPPGPRRPAAWQLSWPVPGLATAWRRPGPCQTPGEFFAPAKGDYGNFSTARSTAACDCGKCQIGYARQWFQRVRHSPPNNTGRLRRAERAISAIQQHRAHRAARITPETASFSRPACRQGCAPLCRPRARSGTPAPTRCRSGANA